MNNIPTFTEQAKYIIENGYCPIFLCCSDCLCNKICENFGEVVGFCEKYLCDLREKKLKRILNE